MAEFSVHNVKAVRIAVVKIGKDEQAFNTFRVWATDGAGTQHEVCLYGGSEPIPVTIGEEC